MAVSADDVRAITGLTLTNSQIDPFIAASGCVMVSISACTTSKSITAECIDQIQIWLTAHLLAVSPLGEKSRSKKSEQFENYSAEWAVSQVQGQGIMSTQYGQMANTLSAGCLANADKTPALICSFG